MQLLLTGATGQIGDFLLPLLEEAGHRVNAISRKSRAPTQTLTWIQADLEEPGSLARAAGHCDVLIHMAPIWTLPPQLPGLSETGIERILAFGSTSRFGKRDSTNPHEREVVNKLIGAEEGLIEQCARQGMDWTLFRPTLIYGSGRDQNVNSIRRFVERWGFFPIAGKGSGLRQPAHAADLAGACLAAMDAEASRNKAYNLSGGETLSYRKMVERIFDAAGRKSRILSLPLPPLRLALKAASRLPGYGFVQPEMADRMNRDLVYEHRDAAADFGYAPRPFDP